MTDTIHVHDRTLFRYRTAVGISVLVPFLGAVLALWLAFYVSSPSKLVLASTFLGCVLSLVGIEIGYHRYLSHRSFVANRLFHRVLLILGCTAGQGPPIYWVANHRRHHAHPDREGDPHSPHGGGRGFVSGFWFAHVAWIFGSELTNNTKFGKDLYRDADVVSVNGSYGLVYAGSVLLPGLVHFAFLRNLYGALEMVLWVGCLRVFVAQQLTYCINSICHISGYRNYDTKDKSSNVLWLMLPTLGSSLHNNHHADPKSAFNSTRWYEIDISGWILATLSAVGIIEKVAKRKQKGEEDHDWL